MHISSTEVKLHVDIFLGSRSNAIKNPGGGHKHDNNNNNDNKMALTSGLSHLGISVTDIQKTAKFLEAVGFKQVGSVEAYPSLFYSDGTILLTIWQTKVEQPVSFDRTANVGLHHLAIKVTSMDALNNAYGIVKDIQGVKIEFPPQEMSGMPLSHFVCYEPCGVRVEFTYHHA